MLALMPEAKKIPDAYRGFFLGSHIQRLNRSTSEYCVFAV
ncbi:hypothetical protein VO64_4988 [Pseudomonas synxantha]|uniref:Uncharacterized protein n=1 Tax=Pseudomonas synxantha TaxID=47883 RepID=A0AAU8TVQ7_9PSED|nr:hypothetical protein VO64_4988 [Pseudomonas synxantha]